MNDNNYILINKYINERPKLKKLIVFIENKSPDPVMWIFYGMLAVLVLKRDLRFLPFGAIPWIDFYIVTKIRNKINRKRPFEALSFEPIINHSPGKSFPSRHASSSVIITMAVWFISPFWGIITAIVSFFVCITRVLTGVHYISDVISGALISFIIGMTTFFGFLK